MATQALVPADLSQSISDLLDSVINWLGQFAVIDWILVLVAFAAIAYVWLYPIAAARLGSIEVAEVAVDGNGLTPVAIKAQLQKELGQRGLLPESGVPSGSPTAASLASAVAESPIPQAKWISTLIALLPVPPKATNFKLAASARTGADGKPVLAYQLTCLGPTPQVKIDEQTGADWPAVIDLAGKEIYRAIGAAAPGIYPVWAHWRNAAALTEYRAGLRAERGYDEIGADGNPSAVPPDYSAARVLYGVASELDPDNMLVRLRAANCLEREQPAQDDLEGRAGKKLDALESYVSIRLRQPAIFEVGYRISVLLSGLATDWGALDEDAPRMAALRTALRRLELEGASEVDDRDHEDRPMTLGFLWKLQGWLVDKPPGTIRRLGLALDAILPNNPREAEVDTLSVAAGLEGQALTDRLQRAAKRESRRARLRLRPFWTVMHEGRLRHRFEPTGGERRQLRKALGISRMCIRVREEGASVSDLGQLWWRARVFWRYTGGRAHVAGWQAHYNAACFYALLPQAVPSDEGRVPFGSARLRNRACWHLAQAVASGRGKLPCSYARDEDPDLKVLRQYSPVRFNNVLGRLCPDEMTVHMPPSTDGEWTISAWGPAAGLAEADAVTLEPDSPYDDSEPVYRIRIQDENKQLHLHVESEAGTTISDSVFPAQLPRREVWVDQDNAAIMPGPPG